LNHNFDNTKILNSEQISRKDLSKKCNIYKRIKKQYRSKDTRLQLFLLEYNTY